MNLKKTKRDYQLIWTVCFFLILFYAIGYSQDIHRLVSENSIEQVESILEKNPLLINAEDRNGRTPLFAAIIQRNTDMVRLLISKGALVRVGDSNLRAPIHFAGFMNDTSMIALLVEHGAVIDTRAIGAATPLIHSSLYNRDALSRFLIEHGADINIQCNALTTPLYFAALNNNLAFLSYLLNNGADIDTPDFLNRSPLFVAVRDGYLKIVKALIEHGANFQFKNAASNRNLLHLAAIRGYVEVADVLIQKGLAINDKDSHGCTPLDYANRYGHQTVADFLKKKGGKASLYRNLSFKNQILNRDIKHGEAIVIKLQNGSWGIRTQKHFLIFAYSEIGYPLRDKSIVNGYLTSDELKDVPCIYFDLTFHPPKAAFSLQGRNPIYSMQDLVKHLSFILNNTFDRNYSPLNLSHAYFPTPEASLNIDGLKVTVVQSYQNNKGYIIECEGLRIFWLSSLTDDHITSKKDTKAIGFVETHFPYIDLMFLGTPDGIGPEKGAGIRETYLESTGLNARAVFFMGKEPLERRILDQIERKMQDQKNIHCSENPGDTFFYSQGGIKR